MKTKIGLILIALIAISNTHASVLTVNNISAGAAQYLQLDPAIAAAAPGDTIYVSKSNTTYSSATITKSITLLGSGTFSQAQIPAVSAIGQLLIGNNISNITIRGFKFSGNLSGASTNVHQVNISENLFSNVASIQFAGMTNCSDFTFSNNIFMNGNDAIYAYNASGCYNFVVQNNIFAQGKLTGFNFLNGLIQNNDFCNSSNGSAFGNFNASPTGLIIKNNIFYNAHPSTYTNSCTFQNNITYSTSVTYPALGGTNIDNINPQFVNVPSTGNFSITNNYKVTSGSPAHNGGSDGNDMGYYGGSVRASVTGEVENIPIIRAMNIANSNIIQNGNVNVNVRSTISR